MSQSDLNSTYERYSKLAERIARLILVGLAVEILAVFFLRKPWSEAAFAISANGLIALGVWGELIFERRAKEAGDSIVAEANARAAEANKAAQEAALELARFRAPRTLSREQLYRVAEKMKPFAPIEFDASVNPGDPEFQQCLRFVELALQLAEWKQKPWDGPYFSQNRSSIGLPSIGLGASVSNVAIFCLIEEGGPPGMNVDAGRMLADALVLEGIQAEARVTFRKREIGAAKQYPIHIAVGPKT